MSRQKTQEHGTVKSYIFGLILSLVFTVIPYYLVVHHTVSGNALLAIILGFAFMQMFIQIAFFLHWGRGPKPNWNLDFFAATGFIILFVVTGSIVIISNLRYNMKSTDQAKLAINNEGIYQIDGKLTGACQQLYNNHQITISGVQASPVRIDAKKCDTLSFVSGDGSSHTIIFGTASVNQAYAGEANVSIQKGHSQTITLSESGTFQFYDQSVPVLSGSFNVSQ